MPTRTTPFPQHAPVGEVPLTEVLTAIRRLERRSDRLVTLLQAMIEPQRGVDVEDLILIAIEFSESIRDSLGAVEATIEKQIATA